MAVDIVILKDSCNRNLLQVWRPVNQENVLSSFVVQVVEKQPGHFLGPCSTYEQLNFIDIQEEEKSRLLVLLVSQWVFLRS